MTKLVPSRDDGTVEGYKPYDAMARAMGGAPDGEPFHTAQELAAYLDGATNGDAVTYDGVARYTAKVLLDYLRSHPDAAQMDANTLFDAASEANDGILDALDLTGFMVGWAVNAARRCVELDPVDNPALFTIQPE